ncbi:MAG: nuclear transport factor 2 family protein [Terriglobia bacterium]|nr:nuclear transport factor 2 family protein [Terriglobia bacterium]
MTRRFLVTGVLVCAVLLIGSVKVKSSTMADETIAGQDGRAILQLIYQYSYTFDGRDLDGFISLFTEDALWEAYDAGAATPTVSLHGTEQLRSVIAMQMNDQISKGIQSRHFQTNTILTRLARDRVQAITMIMVTWQQGSQPATIVHTGFYRDEFTRQGAEWKFVKRQAYLD